MHVSPSAKRSVIFLCLVALAACTTKERPAWPNGAPEVDNVTLREGVVSVPKTVSNRAKVARDTLSFPVEMAAEVQAQWPVGATVLGQPGEDMASKRDNPFGFIRKVTGTHVDGDRLVIDTEQALLDDVLTGQYRKSIDLTSAPNLELPEGTDLSAYDVPMVFGEGKPFPIGLGWDGGAREDSQPIQQQQPLTDAPTLPLFGKKFQAVNIGGPTFSVPAVPISIIDVNDSLNVAGRTDTGIDIVGRALVTPVLDFTPNVRIDYDVSLIHGAQSFEFSLNGNMNFGADYDLAYNVNPRGPITLPQINLLLKGLPNNPFHKSNLKPIGKPIVRTGSIGIVPVVVTVGAFLECTTQYSGSVGAKGGFRANINPTLGARWHKGDGWTSISAFPLTTPTFTGDMLAGGASVTLDCGVIVRATLLVAGLAGPFAQIRGDVVPHIDYTETCPNPATDKAPKDHAGDANLTLGLKAYTALQVGVAIDVLHIIRLEAGPWDVYRKNFNEGAEVLVPNPNYNPNCVIPFFCPPENFRERPWTDIRSWPLARPGQARGSPTEGLWCQVQCDDQAKNGAETDVDCGGPNCAKCGATKTCTANGDCLSNVCGGNGQCVPSLCEDGVKGQQETDIDCGGPNCRACPPVRSDGSPTNCTADRDCAAPYFCSNDGTSPKVCTDNLCRDGRQSGAEPDVDCGAAPGCTSLCAVSKGCTSEADCVSHACNLTTQRCVTSTCFDGRLDGDEADVDCGGSCAAKCALTQACSYVTRQNADCQSNVCSHPGYGSRDGTCVQTTCTDQRVDGSETGVDCGGSTMTCATRCPIGEGCQVTSDCQSGALCHPRTRRCSLPGCDDAIKNGAETSTDCGGPMCVKCSVGKTCSINSDCVSGACNNGQCISGPCANGVKDATEADVDCGGVCGAQACATGKSCTVPTDCASNLCVANRCVSDACLDRVRNGTESDVDCGGATCTARCAATKGCNLNGDCASGVCNTLTRTCVADACNDGVLTMGSESDVDCGGSCGATNTAKRCAVNKRCANNTDCGSGVCNATTLRCVPSQCFDGVKNGSETDLDCGGSCEPKCAATQACVTNADCQSGACNSMNRCSTDQCSDGRLNGSESAIDCGGTCSTKCAVGQACATGADCVHPQMLVGVPGFCHAVTNTCSATSCSDGLLDGNETGVDCGGSCAAKCGLGLGCATGADCASTFCNATTRVCVATQCLDGVTNGTETDVDCGGSCGNGQTTFAQCAVGRTCTRPWDCASGYCGAAGTCINGIPRTCLDIFNRNGPGDRQNTTYVIDPDGPNRIGSTPDNGWNPPFATFCKNQDEGTGVHPQTGAQPGGWTPVMFLNPIQFMPQGPDFASTASCNQQCNATFTSNQLTPLDWVDQCSTSDNFNCARTGGGQCLSDATGATCTQAGPTRSASNPGCHCLRDSRNWPADPAPASFLSFAAYDVTAVAPGLTQDPINWSAPGLTYNTPGTTMARSFQLKLGGGSGPSFVQGAVGTSNKFRFTVYRAGVLVFDSKPFIANPTLNPAQVVSGVVQNSCTGACPVRWSEGEFAAPYGSGFAWCRAGNTYGGYQPPDVSNLISLVDEPVPSAGGYATRNAYIASGFSDYAGPASVRTEQAACKGFGSNLLRPNPTGNMDHSGLRAFVYQQNGSPYGLEVLNISRFLPSPLLTDANNLSNPFNVNKPGYKGVWWGDFGDMSTPRYAPFAAANYNIRNYWMGFCNAMSSTSATTRNTTCDPAFIPTAQTYAPTAQELNLNNINGANSGTMLSQSSGLVFVLWAQ